jgi:hypothetical protein
MANSHQAGDGQPQGGPTPAPDTAQRHTPPGLYWSLRDAARRLDIEPETVQRRIDRGVLVAVLGPGERGLVIPAGELRRYEAEQRARVPPEVRALAVGREPEPGLPEFPLVRAEEDGGRHALPPAAEAGRALCGLEQPENGWYLAGYTTRPFLIPCQECRARADAVLAAIDEALG